MTENIFNITTFDDVYKAVGIIIELSQDLGNYYNQCAELIDVDADNLDARLLDIINDALYSDNKITKLDFENLQMARKEYEYLIREFFWDSSLSDDLKLMNCRLNSIYNCIRESCVTLEKFIGEFKNSYQYFY